MNNINYVDINNLRTEIAILQEDVDARNPGTAKFIIPVIMTSDALGNISIANRNIINYKNGNLTGSTVNMQNTIELYIPTEYTYFCNTDIIPSGTRFIVAFIGGNVNDIKIIGRYDYIDGRDKQ